MFKTIDFRLRAPFGCVKDNYMFTNIEEMVALSAKVGLKVPQSGINRSMEQLIQEMDEADVAIGVVPMRKGNNCDNADIAKLQEAYPGRFVGLAGIDPLEGEGALKEIDDYVINGPASGIIIEPGQFFLAESMNADDKRLYPIYEKCQSAGIPVVLTFGGLLVRGLKYYSPLYIDQVALDFPNLKLVLTHGCWPYVTEIVHIAVQRPNVYLSPDWYLIPQAPGYQDYVTAANYLLQDKIIFGSCYPAFTIKDIKKGYMTNGLRPEVLQKVLYDNAARVLGIE